MAEFRSIQCRIWDDGWFSELPIDARLYWLYLITNRRASVAGIYELPERYAAAESGLPVERIRELHEQWQAAGKCEREGSIVWVVKLRDYQETSSPKLQAKIAQDVAAIPASTIKSRYLAHYANQQKPAYKIPPDPPIQIPYSTDTDTVVSIPLQNPTDTLSTASAVEGKKGRKKRAKKGEKAASEGEGEEQPAAEKPELTDLQLVIGAYIAAYQASFNEGPQITDVVCAQFKRLLKKHSVDEIGAVMMGYIGNPEWEWCDWSVGILMQRYPTIKAKLNGRIRAAAHRDNEYLAANQEALKSWSEGGT